MRAQLLPALSPDRYHADDVGLPVPTLSATIGKMLVEKTPAHAWQAHPKFGGKHSVEIAESPQMTGKILHELVLGAGAGIVEIDAEDWRSKTAREQRDRSISIGKTPVLSRKLHAYRRSARMIVGNLRSMGVIFGGLAEAVILWEEHATNGTMVLCRCMVDHIIRIGDVAHVTDLKTLESASASSCERQASDFSHDIQAAAYSSAIKAVWPEASIEFTFAFAEVNPPNAVTLAELDDEYMAMGRMRWQLAIDRWEECIRTERWPAVYGTGQRVKLRAKPWKLSEWTEQQSPLDLTGIPEASDG